MNNLHSYVSSRYKNESLYVSISDVTLIEDCLREICYILLSEKSHRNGSAGTTEHH